jgi:hypothetical protein
MENSPEVSLDVGSSAKPQNHVTRHLQIQSSLLHVGVSMFLKRHDIRATSAPQEAADRTNSVSLGTFALPLCGDQAGYAVERAGHPTMSFNPAYSRRQMPMSWYIVD